MTLAFAVTAIIPLDDNVYETFDYRFVSRDNPRQNYNAYNKSPHTRSLHNHHLNEVFNVHGFLHYENGLLPRPRTVMRLTARAPRNEAATLVPTYGKIRKSIEFAARSKDPLSVYV